MSLEDDLRSALAREADAHAPGSPSVDAVTAGARRRRTHVAGAVGSAALVVLVGLGLMIVNAGHSTPRTQLGAAGKDDVSTTIAASGPPVGSISGAEPTSTTPSSTTRTSVSSSGSAATAGTAYAPPGSVVYPSPTTTPHTTTTPPPSSGDTVMVNQDDRDKTFTLRKGQHLVVTLDDGSSIWSEPDTDNGTVLPRTAVSANPSSSHVTASFQAAVAGQAHVSASQDAACRAANPPCMVPTRQWQITVIVID